jgi:hypothetical protein
MRALRLLAAFVLAAMMGAATFVSMVEVHDAVHYFGAEDLYGRTIGRIGASIILLTPTVAFVVILIRRGTTLLAPALYALSTFLLLAGWLLVAAQMGKRNAPNWPIGLWPAIEGTWFFTLPGLAAVIWSIVWTYRRASSFWPPMITDRRNP